MVRISRLIEWERSEVRIKTKEYGYNMYVKEYGYNMYIKEL